MGPSSGLEPGLPWPQSRTGAQRAPNPGDVKLAAGKSSIRAPPLPWASPPHLLGFQAVKTPSPGALSRSWGTSRLPPPIGRETAPETSPHGRLGKEGRGLMGVWPGSTRPQPPARVPDPQVP